MTEKWSRRHGRTVEVCIDCGQNPPARDRRKCNSCFAKEERERRAETLTREEHPPCAKGCGRERLVLASQVSSYCRQCHNRVRKEVRVRREYGVSLEVYEAAFASAEGLCAICKHKGRRLVYDHDHATGAHRGVLCDPCNQGLGFFEDDILRLEAAVRYLRRGWGALSCPSGADSG